TRLKQTDLIPRSRHSLRLEGCSHRKNRYPNTKEHHMSFYAATVPAFLQILGSLTGILTKAEAHCKARNIQPETLLGARLYPDMLPFTRQIQLACGFSAKRCARLMQNEVASPPDSAKSFG